MKEWILYNWKIFPWVFGLTILIIGGHIINTRLTNKTNPDLKVKKYCLELAKKLEGIELNPQEAEWVPIGANARSLSYSGIMMVWNESESGMSITCTIVSEGTQVKYFAVNGVDKTSLARREERKK